MLLLVLLLWRHWQRRRVWSGRRKRRRGPRGCGTSVLASSSRTMTGLDVVVVVVVVGGPLASSEVARPRRRATPTSQTSCRDWSPSRGRRASGTPSAAPPSGQRSPATESPAEARARSTPPTSPRPLVRPFCRLICLACCGDLATFPACLLLRSPCMPLITRLYSMMQSPKHGNGAMRNSFLPSLLCAMHALSAGGRRLPATRFRLVEGDDRKYAGEE